MNNSGSRWMRLFRESFVPVIIVILGLFLMLLYVQFRAEYDADKVTVIDIQPVAPLLSESETADAPGDSEPIVSSGSDPDQQRAHALMGQKKWPEAERIYLRILARQYSARALKDLGVLYLKKGDLPRALDYFNKAAAADPSDTSVLFNRAIALSRSGRDREAVEAYRALLTKQPDHFEGQFNMATLLIKQGDKAAGAAALEAAAQMASGKRKAHALYSLGVARRDMGQFAAAANAFEAAIRLQPMSVAPRVGLATLEPDTPEGQARALTQYRKILELKPNYSPALVNMAVILGAQNKRHEAEQALRQAIQFDPEYVRAHTELGSLLLDRKRWQDARNEFEWLLQRDPARADAYFNLGRVAYGEKDYVKAIDAYQTALKTASGNYPEALLNLGLTYSARNDFAEAIAAYEAALKARRQYPEAWYNIGMVYLRQKNNERAEVAFNNAVKLRPDYEQAWFNLGVVHGNYNRDKESIDAYRKALSIRPDYPQAQLNLAVRYAKRKEYDEAIRLYREILARDESYSIAWFNLGSAYIGNGQPAEAVEALRKAIALDPSNTKTLLFLGRALLLDKKDSEAVQVLENAVAADPADARLRLELARALRQSGRESDASAELEKAQQLDPKLRGIDEELQKSEVQ
ncbi:MAG: tetratricopeptide repeat protein [Pseudomonadota bacterium]